MAPELIVTSKPTYSFSVDWWSLGIIAYEMSCGKTPFQGVGTNRDNYVK